MFTGIVQAVGKITRIKPGDQDCAIYLDCAGLAGENINIGDSIAVNGCCLTVVEHEQQILKVDVSAETLRCTAIGNYEAGSLLNLELAMLPHTRFGGHIVSGHVDCLAEVVKIENQGRSLLFEFKLGSHGRYVAEKGSITIDGVSLTVNDVTDTGEFTHFTVNIIPHTLEATIIGSYELGTIVNIEIDLIARYLERLGQSVNHNESNEQGNENG